MWGDMAYYIPAVWRSEGVRVPRVHHQITAMDEPKKDQHKPNCSGKKHTKKNNDGSMQIGILILQKQYQLSKLTQLSVASIVFIAHHTSANKTSHCHWFCNLSHNHNMLYNIVSFQSSPDIQNCIYQFCTHSVSQF